MATDSSLPHTDNAGLYARLQATDSKPVLKQALILLDTQCGDKLARSRGYLTAEILQRLRVDETTLVAAILGSPELINTLDLDLIGKQFGKLLAQLVKNVRWLNSFDDGDWESRQRPQQAERVRRMVLAMVDDVRAVVIKLAYRLQHLKEELPKSSYEMRRIIAVETLDIYTPLANRLGLAQLKWELEDYAFRYLEPQAYKQLAKALEEKRTQREAYLTAYVADLRAALHAEGLTDCEVYGRPKHIYSIWRKMQQKQLQFSDLFDIRAVRILVESVSQCYLALGVVHSRWQHIPKEFDDYIANPKGNGYQSLHTAIIGPESKAVEVQIRTHIMHQYAELGVAAHWRYKENSIADQRLANSVKELRNLLEHGSNDDALVDSFRTELYTDRVFVFTPKGEVIDLPKGATPVDFAYQIHTEIGHRCRGAKINGQITNLRTALKNGDHVDILTGKHARPSRDWLSRELGYLKSAKARAKVRTWFNFQDQEKHLEDGKNLLERELKRLNRRDINLEKLTRQLRFEKHSDLYLAIGRNEITSANIATAVDALEAPAIADKKTPPRVKAEHRLNKASGICVMGVGNLLVQMPRCCNPVPYDPIIGYITKGSGVSIHRADCHNVLNLPDANREQLIEVSWGEQIIGRYHAGIKLRAFTRERLLNEIANLITNEGAELTALNTGSNKRGGLINIRLQVEVNSVDQLSRIINKLSQLSSVQDVSREG